MAKSVNKATLLGTVGKDPEVRTLPSGTKVANFSVATSDRFKDKTGEWKEQTEWHTVVAYGRLAEIIEQYVKKGSRLYLEGKIETRSWEDARSGEKKYQTQIKIDDLVLAGGAPGDRSSSTGYVGGSAPDKSVSHGYSGGHAQAARQPAFDEPDPDWDSLA